MWFLYRFVQNKKVEKDFFFRQTAEGNKGNCKKKKKLSKVGLFDDS